MRQENGVAFDKMASGGGLEVICRLESGKAYLEWKLYLASFEYCMSYEIRNKEKTNYSMDICDNTADRFPVGEGMRCGDRKEYVRIILTDTQGGTALECIQSLREEEPLCSVLLQPMLWQGVGNPYLYRLDAMLMDGQGRCRDRIRRQLPLRVLSCHDASGQKEFLLNGVALEIRAVKYSLINLQASLYGKTILDNRMSEETRNISEYGMASDAGMVPGAEASSDVWWKTKSTAYCQRRLLEDFRQLIQLGANCICLDTEQYGVEGEATEDFRKSDRCTGLDRFFLQLCDRFGFLVFQKSQNGAGYVWIQNQQGQGCGKVSDCDVRDSIDCRQDAYCVTESFLGMGGEIPSFRGQGECLLLPDGQHPSPLFYRYQAMWSREPFVYIVPESIKRLESGNYSALCYSNCERVALYSDGMLFAFQKGTVEFQFQEIPVKTPCIMLTAEGDGCSQSLSIHKSYVRQWSNNTICH